MTPQYRIEQYLDAIRGAWLGESPLPAHPDEPVWRIEKFLAAILSAVKGDSPVVVCPDPVWRLEEFGRAIYDAITSASPAWPCPTPASSLEVFLHAIYAMVVDGTEEGTPTPSWDIESWLVDVYNAAKEGSGEEKTVSGVLIHITDALAKAALSVLASIEPIQDLHGYANPWPGGGGKNLVDPSKKVTASATTGKWYNDGTGFLLHSGQAYALSANVSTDATYFVYIYAIGGTQLAYGKWTATYTPSADVYVYFQYYESGGAHLADAELQLELGSTATSFAPYANICPISGLTGLSVYVSPTQDPDDATTYNVYWATQAGTVYHGTVDVVSGELTVDMVNIPSYNGETINEPWLSSMDAYAAGTTPTIGAQVVYALATPITYQLTPQEVQMLLGENNVWSSSGDTVSVTYYAEGNANPLQSLNILLGGNYSNPKTADDVSDREALEIILGGNK